MTQRSGMVGSSTEPAIDPGPHVDFINGDGSPAGDGYGSSGGYLATRLIALHMWDFSAAADAGF